MSVHCARRAVSDVAVCHAGASARRVRRGVKEALQHWHRTRHVAVRRSHVAARDGKAACVRRCRHDGTVEGAAVDGRAAAVSGGVVRMVQGDVPAAWRRRWRWRRACRAAHALPSNTVHHTDKVVDCAAELRPPVVCHQERSFPRLHTLVAARVAASAAKVGHRGCLRRWHRRWRCNGGSWRKRRGRHRRWADEAEPHVRRDASS